MATRVCFSIRRRSAIALAVLFAFGLLLAFADGGSLAVSAPTENCFVRNLYNSLMFKCKRPQARAFRSSEVIGGLVEEGEHIKPSVTVLHRCDASSGCCIRREGMTCAPKDTEVVRLDFKVGPRSSKAERMVTILARNHTACGCVEDGMLREEEIAVRAFVFPAADLEGNTFS